MGYLQEQTRGGGGRGCWQFCHSCAHHTLDIAFVFLEVGCSYKYLTTLENKNENIFSVLRTKWLFVIRCEEEECGFLWLQVLPLGDKL